MLTVNTEKVRNRLKIIKAKSQIGKIKELEKRAQTVIVPVARRNNVGLTRGKIPNLFTIGKQTGHSRIKTLLQLIDVFLVVKIAYNGSKLNGVESQVNNVNLHCRY